MKPSCQGRAGTRRYTSTGHDRASRGPAPGKGDKARWKEDRGRQAEQASEAEETRPLLSSQAVQDCSSAHSTPHSGLTRGRWGTDGWLTDPEGRCLRNLGPSAGGCSFIGRLCPVTWTRPSRLTSISGPRRTWCSCGAIRLASMLMQSVNLIGHQVSMPARIAADAPGISNHPRGRTPSSFRCIPSSSCRDGPVVTAPGRRRMCCCCVPRCRQNAARGATGDDSARQRRWTPICLTIKKTP